MNEFLNNFWSDLEALLADHWIIWVFGVVFLVLVLHFIAARIFSKALKRAETTKIIWDDALIFGISGPIELGIWVFGINFAALIMARLTELEWISAIATVNRVAVVLLISWAALRFLKRAELNMTAEGYLEKPMDVTTAKALANLIKASIVITASLVVLQTLGFSISGVLAFGGIGGIAVGFAARDLLANFFGALTIYLDKPFAVGDWVRSPDKSIEGTVEDIGWRRCVIRTFDKRPLYVPNSAFNTISVENPSRMLNRRINETIGVRYSDAEKLPEIVAAVKKMLTEHEDIDNNQIIMVNFNSFAPSSLDFFIYTFTKTTDWATYHDVKQDVLFQIENIIRDKGAEIAFPTSTVYTPDLERGGPQEE
jgi:MscS family membrane protein